MFLVEILPFLSRCINFVNVFTNSRPQNTLGMDVSGTPVTFYLFDLCSNKIASKVFIMQKMWTYKSMEKAINKVQMIGRFLFFKYSLSETEQMDCSLGQLFVLDFEEYDNKATH